MKKKQSKQVIYGLIVLLLLFNILLFKKENFQDASNEIPNKAKIGSRRLASEAYIKYHYKGEVGSKAINISRAIRIFDVSAQKILFETSTTGVVLINVSSDDITPKLIDIYDFQLEFQQIQYTTPTLYLGYLDNPYIDNYVYTVTLKKYIIIDKITREITYYPSLSDGEKPTITTSPYTATGIPITEKTVQTIPATTSAPLATTTATPAPTTTAPPVVISKPEEPVKPKEPGAVEKAFPYIMGGIGLVFLYAIIFGKST